MSRPLTRATFIGLADRLTLLRSSDKRRRAHVVARMIPLTEPAVQVLEGRNADIIRYEAEAGNYSPANLDLPMPELPARGDPSLHPYDRMMQLQYMTLIMAARGELTELPIFGSGAFEEALNRGWYRPVTGYFFERAEDEEPVMVCELNVTAEGEIGPAGIYFAIPEVWPPVPRRTHGPSGVCPLTGGLS